VLGTINPHSGLSPVRLRPCWAHIKKEGVAKCETSLKIRHILAYKGEKSVSGRSI